jgi:hypothetical protein
MIHRFVMKLKLVALIFFFLHGCAYLSPKGYQCSKDAFRVRHDFSSNVYRGMSREELEERILSNKMYKSVYLNKKNDSLYTLNYGGCPIRRYIFENGILVKEGYLYFEGFWFYDDVVLPLHNRGE